MARDYKPGDRVTCSMIFIVEDVTDMTVKLKSEGGQPIVADRKNLRFEQTRLERGKLYRDDLGNVWLIVEPDRGSGEVMNAALLIKLNSDQRRAGRSLTLGAKHNIDSITIPYKEVDIG